MTTDERFQIHEQMMASIEANISALVEAQQKGEKRLDRVGAMVKVGMKMLVALVRHERNQDRRIDRLAEGHKEIQNEQRELQRMLKHFLASQMHRDGRGSR